MKLKITILTFSIALLFGCSATKKTATPTPPETPLPPEIAAKIPENITFEKHIKAITIQFCGGGYCHHGSPSVWSKYENMKQIVDNGELKEEVIVHKTMPEGKKLPALEYHIIKKWLETGAKEK